MPSYHLLPTLLPLMELSVLQLETIVEHAQHVQQEGQARPGQLRSLHHVLLCTRLLRMVTMK